METMSQVTGTGGDESQDRDEIKEVKRLASQDTKRIRLWRFVVMITILATAAAVTASTYTLLKDEETDDFETAVSRTQPLAVS